MSLSDLKRALRSVADGSDLSEAEIEALEFSSENRAVQAAANGAWEHLLHFAGDGDIRLKDKEYEGCQRESARLFLNEIEALERGEDPRGRRLS